MSVRILVSVKGIVEAIGVLNEKLNHTKEEIQKAMIKVGATMESEVKQSIAGRKESAVHIIGTEHVSVDTGRFLNSVSFSADSEQVTIFSNIKYAPYLEYGTGFHLSPRAHFTNAKYRNKQKCRDIIQERINNI